MKNQKLFLIFILFVFFQPVFGQGKKDQQYQCDDKLWKRVYHSYRLKVIEKCKKVTGVVVEAKFESDGDAHILLKLDGGQEGILNKMNYEMQGGYLVLEPVCATLIGGKTAEVECNGYINNVYLPRVGEHVEVIGSFVLDTKHGWNEIHPVTSIRPLNN